MEFHLIEELPSSVRDRAQKILLGITQKANPPIEITPFGQIKYKGAVEHFSSIEQLLTMATCPARAKIYNVPGLPAFLAAVLSAGVPFSILSHSFQNLILENDLGHLPEEDCQMWIRFEDRLIPFIQNAEKI